jgi:hypothetical protein
VRDARLCYTGAVSLAVPHERAGRAVVARVVWIPEPATGIGGEASDASPRRPAGYNMGKYKQWLHHQEIGHRLRDQINTLEQERARVQKMAPSHPTSLPDLDNPLIAALLNYTRQGNKLSDIDPIQAAMPKMDPDLDRPRPATSAALAPAQAAASAAATGPLRDEAVVSSLLARAESIPSDPLDQMRELSRAREQEETMRAGYSSYQAL